MNLAFLMRRAAQQHAERPAVVGPNGARTYRQLDQRARGLASGLLAQGLQPGDRVAVLLHNRIEYPEIDMALAYGGFVRVALNARLGLREFRLATEDCQARAIISEPGFDEDVSVLTAESGMRWIRLDGAPETAAGDDYETLVDGAPSWVPALDQSPESLAWISYTSGTTGRPKGVMLSHRALAAVAFNLMLETGPASELGSVMLPQPLSHGAGYFALAYLASGAAVHVAAEFDPEEITRRGRVHGIDTLKLVPTMLSRLLAAELPGPTPFRHIVYGASPIDGPIMEDALERFGPILSQIYGQSEAPVTITCLKEHDHARPGPHRASAGRPWRTVDVRVLDPDGRPLPPGVLGEVAVRGPHLMTGYYGNSDLTADVMRSGWVWTKDMGITDEEGYIYLRGRRDDMINSGGFNIAPREVEEALLVHPAVQECAVVGVPDPEWGESICAFVVPRPGGAVDVDDLAAFAKDQLGFRRPRRIVELAALPYTSYGKVDRRALFEVGTAAGDGAASAGGPPGDGAVASAGGVGGDGTGRREGVSNR